MLFKYLRTYVGTALVKAVIFAGSIVTIQVISYLYGPAMVGAYSIAISAVLLFGLVYRSGLPTLVLRNRVKFPDQDINFQYNALLFYLIHQSNRRIALIALWIFILIYILSTGVEEAMWLYVASTPIAFVSAWLQLRSAFLKANGQPVLASLLDMGLVQLGLALVILVIGSKFLQAPPFLPFAIVGISAMLFWLRVCRRCPNNHSEFSRLADRTDQRKILANAILTFLYRNGYPLIFGAFVSAHTIGYFRIEERLAYSISFIVLLTETLIMKKLINAVNTFTGVTLLKILYRYMMIALLPTIAASICLAFLLSNPKVANALNISPNKDWFYSVFAAAPLFAYIQFNTLLLNLKGFYRTIAINMIVTFAVFLIASFMLHSQQGLAGIRQAYLLAAVVSAVWVCVVTVYTFRMEEDSV